MDTARCAGRIRRMDEGSRETRRCPHRSDPGRAEGFRDLRLEQDTPATFHESGKSVQNGWPLDAVPSATAIHVSAHSRRKNSWSYCRNETIVNEHRAKTYGLLTSPLAPQQCGAFA